MQGIRSFLGKAIRRSSLLVRKADPRYCANRPLLDKQDESLSRHIHLGTRFREFLGLFLHAFFQGFLFRKAVGDGVLARVFENFR